MALQIPERDHRRLEQLVALSEDEFEDLYQALAAAEPSLRASEFTSRVAARSKLESSVLSDIVRILINLYWLSVDQELSPEVVAEEVIRTAAEEDLHAPEGGWDRFKKYIPRLLSLQRTLGVASRAVYVATQYPCHLHSSRVLTDARPVFETDATKPPVAFVLNHILQLDVHVASESDKELFIALDGDDLLALRRTIDRAIAKEKSLRKALRSTSVPILSITEPEAE